MAMKLTENLLEVLAGLACDDETEGPGSPSVMEVPPLSSGLVVTVADGARRIYCIEVIPQLLQFAAQLLAISHPWETKLWAPIRRWVE